MSLTLNFLWYPNLRYAFAVIWLVNGLFCKVLNLVPRHERIVAAIMGEEQARVSTLLIGLAEVAMAIWIFSGWRYRLCASLQIVVILVMNAIEFFAVPDLLLWGRLNAVFALSLAVIIFLNAFGRQRQH